MKTRRLIRSLLAATLLWSASVYGEKYVAPSSAELDTNADDWTVELRCANSKPCAAWVRRVGSRLHVFPPDADKDGAHQSDTRIYTFAFADVDRIRFHGSDENDYFENNTGIPCKASGKAGHDVLIGGWGDDELRGDDGQDTIHGGEGNDFISGGKGQDYLYGEAGDDEIYGGNHTDWIWGDFKSEYTPGAVDISSDQTRGGGDDEIDGGDGKDWIAGGPGDDTIKGGRGPDEITGEDGDDTILGGRGRDTLRGGKGNDTIEGGKDKDCLWGGDGVDVLKGGGNTDWCQGDGDDTKYRCEKTTSCPN